MPAKNNASPTNFAAPPDLQVEATGVVAWAKTLAIRTPAEYTAAIYRLQTIKAIAWRVKEFFLPMKQSADETKRRILDAEKQLAIPLAQAEEIAKSACSEYQRIEEEKRKAEQRRLQAIADEKARKEREALEKQAAKIKSAEKKEALLEQAAAVQSHPVEVVSKVPQVAGASTRKTWTYEITNMAQFLDYAMVNRRHDMVLPNEDFLKQYALSMRERAAIDGVKFSEKTTLAIGTR